MRARWLPGAAALAVMIVAAQEPAPPPTPGESSTIKGGDARLLEGVRVIAERTAGILGVKTASGLVAVRADASTRASESAARARRTLDAERVAARGRAWHDLGIGAGAEPQELITALASDLDGMTFDATRARLLVDPKRLRGEVGESDPDDDADASVLQATGVAPDEPVVAHYVVHQLLDEGGLEGAATTDALLARQALAEGEANLAALILLFGGVGLETEVFSGAVRPEDALGGRLVPSAMHSASPLVTNFLEFIYLDGFAQSASLAKKGGFVRLARERAGRRTTRDVIHADRAPTAVAALTEPSLPPTLHLSVADHDALGEQGIVAAVSLLTGKDNLGLIAGDGWDGDALWRFEASPGTEGITVWVTRWRTPDDANDFAYALERCLQSRFPGENAVDDASHGGKVLPRSDRVFRIERSPTEVVFRAAPPAIDEKLFPPTKKKVSTSQRSTPK